MLSYPIPIYFSANNSRVKYGNPEDLLLLRPAIESQTLDETDRLGIMDDLFALVTAGKMDTVSALKVIEAFKANEESYVVWSSITNCLGKLKVIVCDMPYFQSHFKPYVLDLMANILNKVGWEKQVNNLCFFAFFLISQYHIIESFDYLAVFTAFRPA